MGGFFGAVSKRDCILDVFFGTDYHSHLGTRRGGMAAYDPQLGLQREIHNIENSPFRTKFDGILNEMKGTSAIGCISDTDPQPLLIRSNLGSWATASTSKWGLAWKAVHDHYGNIGMTLTHPQEYYDIDEYLKSGKVIPGFQNAKKHGLFEECCGYACMNWYKEWYLKQNTTGIKQLEIQADVVSTLYYNIEGKEVEKPIPLWYYP